MRDFMIKLKSEEYIKKFEGCSPFYIGCFYGSSVVLGGEEKFRHCYDFFSGIGDVEWWIKEEIDKLSIEELSNLRYILKRNKEVDDFITKNHNRIIDISYELELEGSHIIHRLNNSLIVQLIESNNIKDKWKEING